MIKQWILDWLFKQQANWGWRKPSNELWAPKQMSASGFGSHTDFIFRPKELFMWYPKLQQGVRYPLDLRCEWNPSPAPADGIKRPFSAYELVSGETESWVGRTLEVYFTSFVGSKGWNAIWLYGVNSEGVNHEIDLIEHYGKNGNPIAETNLHWGDYENNHNQLGAVPITNTNHKFINGRISLDWTNPNRIDVLYNDTLVRRVVDPDVIATFLTSEMRIILSSKIEEGATSFQHSRMRIDLVKFY